jgi:3-oxoacyl-[acyl-carrier-protein] synthase II
MCAALDALAYAKDFITIGRFPKVIVGAVEDLAVQTFLGFYKLKYLSGLNGNTPISCPFDKRRNGIIFSEGSIVFILEDLASARKRKAKMYAQVLGVGSSFDPLKFYNYNPEGTGMIEAMQLALKDVKIKPQDIDCIFANANSTKDADLIETKAIKEVFGTYVHKIPITAIKSILGESYSASGGFSIVAALAALQKGEIPPTMNYKEKDPGCDLDYVVNNRKKKLERVMLNTFGPNGANTTLILGLPKG